MKRIIMTLCAASSLVMAGVASSSEQLTSVQMDSVTAGSHTAADALATAFGNTTFANTATTTTNTVTGEVVLPEGGKVQQILATAIAQSASGADGQSGAIASAGGAVVGDNVADSTSYTSTVADSITPLSSSTAWNTSAASSLIRGWSASSASMSGVSSFLVLH
jgi:hypothetical protein